MLRRLRAGENGFLSLLMNELKSTKSFSMEREDMLLSLWQGLMGQGRGDEGGLLVAKNDVSSDGLK